VAKPSTVVTVEAVRTGATRSAGTSTEGHKSAGQVAELLRSTLDDKVREMTG
jgi:hypothetical protein